LREIEDDITCWLKPAVTSPTCLFHTTCLSPPSSKSDYLVCILRFLLLVAEVITFLFIVFPMPFAVKKNIFTFLSNSPIVGKMVYALKISFIFIGILFLDAVQRMFRITAEVSLAKEQGGGVHNTRGESTLYGKMFYAQRNAYLTGFCLFLSIILTRTFYIILDLIHVQEEYAKLKTQYAGGVTDQEGQATIKKLQTQLASKDKDIETLKKQASQLSQEYDRVATELNKATGKASDKRRD